MTETEAWAAVVEHHGYIGRNIRRSVCSKLPAHETALEVDDLVCAGLITAFRAALTYDATQGSSLRSWLAFRAVGGALDELRMRLHPMQVLRKGRPIAAIVSLSKPLSDADSSETLEDTLAGPDDTEEREELQERSEVLEAVLSTLPTRERWVLTERMSGRTLQAIADDAGVTEARVCQVLKEATNHVTKALDSCGRHQTTMGVGHL